MLAITNVSLVEVWLDANNANSTLSNRLTSPGLT